MRWGPYEAVRELGRGGMGLVLLGRDPRNGDEVALKILLATDAARRERFAREATALLRLRHPGIVRILDAGSSGESAWVALELVRGGTLRERLAAGPLEPREAARIVLALTRAIEAAHQAGVLHRDLKPDNVLLTRDGEPVLTDFGLAGFTADAGMPSLTLTGALQGTPGWWAPEQVRGKPDEVGPAVDVYGLGALCYGLLTGRPPIEAATLAEALSATLLARPPAPGRDPALDAIALRCLEKRPDDRYPDAAALAAALERWLEGPPPRRRRAALLVVGLLLLVAGLAFGGRGPAVEGSAPVASLASRVERDDGRLLDQAAARVNAGDLPGALALCDAAVALAGPRLADALAARGAVRTRQGDMQGAIADYDHALAQDPRHVDALRFRAMARQGQPGALDDLLRAAELAPGDARVWRALANARFAGDDLPGAIADLGRAIALAPDDPEPLRLRARMRQRIGAVPEAQADWGRALQLAPRHGPTWRERGQAKLQWLGDASGATEDLTRALDLDEGDVWALELRAQAWLRLNQPRKAVADMDRAVALAPRDGFARYVRAQAHTVLNAIALARADLEQALLLEPDASWSASARQGLGALGAVGPRRVR